MIKEMEKNKWEKDKVYPNRKWLRLGYFDGPS